MKNFEKEARRLKSKIEYRRLLEKMKKRFWSVNLDFLAQYDVYGYLDSVVDLVEEFQDWERRSGGKFAILLIFPRKR